MAFRVIKAVEWQCRYVDPETKRCCTLKLHHEGSHYLASAELHFTNPEDTGSDITVEPLYAMGVSFSWESIERAALTDATLHRAVTLVHQGVLTKGQALMQAALTLSHFNATLIRQLTSAPYVVSLPFREGDSMPGDKGGKAEPNNPSDKPTNLPQEFEKPTDKGDKGTSGVPGQRTTKG